MSGGISYPTSAVPEGSSLSDDDLLTSLEDAYAALPARLCPICGKPLVNADFNPPVLTLVCSSYQQSPAGEVTLKPGRTQDDEHYYRSMRREPNPGDSRVLELIRRFRRLLEETNKACVSEALPGDRP